LERIILDEISFEVDETGLLELLRLQPSSERASEFSQLMAEARLIAKPKAAFAVTTAQATDDRAVNIGGVQFTSRVLRVNLDSAGIVFPYIATCGLELDEWSRKNRDVLQSFWTDTIMLMALGCAVNHLNEYLKHKLGENVVLSAMNPGSLEDWPIEAQVPLFSLLGDCSATIGVRLTAQMSIRPLKSVSGILFVSEESFQNCSLCPRQACPLRRAVYNKNLYAEKYATG
jgi:hypothetical protein